MYKYRSNFTLFTNSLTNPKVDKSGKLLPQCNRLGHQKLKQIKHISRQSHTNDTSSAYTQTAYQRHLSADHPVL